MSRSDDLYARLPVPLQHAAVSAFGASWAWRRFGPGFRQAARQFAERDRWSQEQWNEFTQVQLTRTLANAVDHVPYYRDTYSVAERRAAKEGRLADLPVLAKDAVRRDPERFIDPTRRPHRPIVFHTSGSSGTPVATVWSVRELRASMALREVRSAQWAGVSFRQPRATFSGRMVEPNPDSTGPFHRFNAIERQVYLSPFHLRRDTAPAYAEALRHHKIRWGTGYAVSFAILAGFMLDAGVEPLALDAVVTTSEKLTPQIRDRIQAAFGCPVFEEYSMVENALFASECADGGLHVSPDVGVIEILRPDGMPADSGEVGEVFATTLMRGVQPLVRYRVGDLARWSGDACPCGRAMPVLAEVSGRVEDVVVGPDGRELVRFHGIFVGMPEVVEAQVVQEAIDRFRLVVVAERGFTHSDEEEMIARMRQRLGYVAVRVELVDRIPRTSSGKFRAVISELNNG